MSNRDIVRRVGAFIGRYHLLKDDALCLSALSGGADSVALLLIQKQLGYRVEAVHCNFQLRGDEAERDEQFCVELCQSLGVKLHRIHFDTQAYASLHKMSIEMAARELRYTFFAKLKEDIHAEAVCVGHHQDDSVETILINLVRGTGLQGLTGIDPERDGIVRPLLCLTRQDILDFLNERKQPFVTDSTNLVATEATRNMIRLEVMPRLLQINPAAGHNILRTALHLRQAAAVVDAAMRDAVRTVSEQRGDCTDISIGQLLRQPSPPYTLYYILRDFGFSSTQVDSIAARLDAETGTTFTSATHILVFDRNHLLIEPISPTPLRRLRVPEEGIYVYDDSRKFAFKKSVRTPDFSIPDNRATAWLDAQKVCFPITITPYATGDRFHPLGMNGSRLVSDFLTDRKLSLLEKRRQLIMKDATGAVIWVVGERIDHRFRITETTKDLLHISQHLT